MNILDKIVEKTRMRVAALKNTISTESLRDKAQMLPVGDFLFEKALRKNGISFICEIKKASPSKGVIAENFPYLNIAKEYEEAGADAISVLTEPDFFLGNIKYIEEITREIKTPILRKDFIVDEIMIYEAKIATASAILLICAILDDDRLKKFIEIATGLGLSCLVEAHDEQEIKRALNAGAKIIGVNNRDLKTFNVDIQNGIKLRKYVPSDIIFVSESGIKTREDIIELEKNNVNAVLIGETFMRSNDKKRELELLRGKTK